MLNLVLSKIVLFSFFWGGEEFSICEAQCHNNETICRLELLKISTNYTDGIKYEKLISTVKYHLAVMRVR